MERVRPASEQHVPTRSSWLFSAFIHGNNIKRFGQAVSPFYFQEEGRQSLPLSIVWGVFQWLLYLAADAKTFYWNGFYVDSAERECILNTCNELWQLSKAEAIDGVEKDFSAYFRLASNASWSIRLQEQGQMQWYDFWRLIVLENAKGKNVAGSST